MAQLPNTVLTLNKPFFYAFDVRTPRLASRAPKVIFRLLEITFLLLLFHAPRLVMVDQSTLAF